MLQLSVHVFNNDQPAAAFTMGLVSPLFVWELDINMVTWQSSVKIPTSLVRTKEPTLGMESFTRYHLLVYLILNQIFWII